MKKKLTPYLLVVLLALPTFLPFLNNKFFYTQDYIFIARLQQMSAALSSGQFPVRWAPDLRFGEPLFNFYASLPYYLGALIKLSGLNFIWVAKILFILSTLLSALTMYLFCNKVFSRRGAILATILYTYAPYRAVDIYVRGALSEAWSFIFFPLIFLGSYFLSQKINSARICFLSLSLAGLFLTHNVTSIMFIPFLFLWWLYLIIKQKNWKVSGAYVVSSILGFFLAAFFLLPAIFERQFIQTKYLIVGYFNFRAHFVAYKQFFSTFWGYGSSLWGPDDGLSFQVGLAHWMIIVLAVIFGFVFRKDKKSLWLLSFLGVSFLLSLFLQHNKSAFIWEAIPVMAFIQFPWRFLGISIFIASVIGAAVARYLKNNIVFFILIAFVISSTFFYFRPKEYVDDTFFDKFLNTASTKKGVDLTKDYLPVWVEDVDGDVFDAPRARSGNIEVSDLKKTSTSLRAHVTVATASLVEAPITYFPGWQVRANKQIVKLESPSKLGLIMFNLPKGDYLVNIDFKDTMIRGISNVISLVSFTLVIFVGLRKFIFK